MAAAWPSVNDSLIRYDIHIYFDEHDQEDVKSAYDLRNALKRAFPDLQVYPPVHKPIGPHLQAQFEAHIESEEQFGRVVPWLCLNHKHHSALIHPYHKDESEEGYDHSRYPLWLGKQLQLDNTIFTSRGIPV